MGAPPKIDGVAKNPPYGVTLIFQDLDILVVCLRPRKITKPRWTKFLLSHLMSFCEFVKMGNRDLDLLAMLKD
jgi:hypothetical protein